MENHTLDDLHLFPDDYAGLPPITVVDAHPTHSVYKIIVRTDLEKLEAAVNGYLVEHAEAYPISAPNRLSNEEYVQALITYGVLF